MKYEHSCENVHMNDYEQIIIKIEKNNTNEMSDVLNEMFEIL